MIKERRQPRQPRYWVITDDGDKIPLYSLSNFTSIPSHGVNRVIVSDLEINNTMRRNKALVKAMEKLYRRRIK